MCDHLGSSCWDTCSCCVSRWPDTWLSLMSPWCPLLCKGSVPGHSLLPGAPRAQLQLQPEPPALSASLSTWHELILLSPPWDCWAEGLHNSIPDSSAIQLAFPPGRAWQHPQVSHSSSPPLPTTSPLLRAQICTCLPDMCPAGPVHSKQRRHLQRKGKSKGYCAPGRNQHAFQHLLVSGLRT